VEGKGTDGRDEWGSRLVRRRAGEERKPGEREVLMAATRGE